MCKIRFEAKNIKTKSKHFLTLKSSRKGKQFIVEKYDDLFCQIGFKSGHIFYIHRCLLKRNPIEQKRELYNRFSPFLYRCCRVYLKILIASYVVHKGILSLFPSIDLTSFLCQPARKDFKCVCHNRRVDRPIGNSASITSVVAISLSAIGKSLAVVLSETLLVRLLLVPD